VRIYLEDGEDDFVGFRQPRGCLKSEWMRALAYDRHGLGDVAPHKALGGSRIEERLDLLLPSIAQKPCRLIYLRHAFMRG